MKRIIGITFLLITCFTLGGCTGTSHLRSEPDWDNQGEGSTAVEEGDPGETADE